MTEIMIHEKNDRGAVPVEPWLARWFEIRPSYEPLATALLGRIIRLNPAWERYRATTLRELGLTVEVSDLIVALLRSGPPYELSPTALSTEAILTSGAITYRIDRAEAQGLVERHRSDNDRRGVMVRLTEIGLALANRDMETHLELIERLMRTFSPEERTMLATLMQKLLAELSV